MFNDNEIAEKYRFTKTLATPIDEARRTACWTGLSRKREKGIMAGFQHTVVYKEGEAWLSDSENEWEMEEELA